MDRQMMRPHLRLDDVIKLAIRIQQARDDSPYPPELEPMIYAIDVANQQALPDFAMAMYQLGIHHALNACKETT